MASGADKFYIKTDKKDGSEFVRFVRKATKKDGSEGKPISVIGPDGQEWPQDKMIGNGSVLNFKYSLNEVTSQGKKRLKPSILALQVWDHEEFIRGSGFPTREASTSNITEEASAW